jgi:hypothetical protein
MPRRTHRTKFADPLDPDERLITGVEIDEDLRITGRGRRKMIEDGRLPPPAGYVAGRAVWRLVDYRAAKQKLLATGKPRRFGERVRTEDSAP